MKTKKVEKVITTLKDSIDHPLKRHLTEILNQSTTLNVSLFFRTLYIVQNCSTKCTCAAISISNPKCLRNQDKPTGMKC